MKVVFVIDNISNLKNKINLIQSNFGNNIYYVVKSNFVEIAKTYGITASGVYQKNLAEIIHICLSKTNSDDTIIYYSSLEINNQILTKFASKVVTRSKIVNLVPKYNFVEQMINGAYNIYVKSLFKLKDSMISPKLQFLPEAFVQELLATHFGNRIFELDPELCINVTYEDKDINKSMKVKTNTLKPCLLSLIIALVITAVLLLNIAFFKMHYIVILIYVILYLLNITLLLIILCKAKFDQRFLR